MNKPIASYSESRFDGQRFVELYPDYILISGSASLGAHFKHTVPLSALTATPDRVWLRPSEFLGGISGAVICSTLALGFDSVLSAWWKGLIWGVALSGALLALSTSRRVQWVVFRNQQGAEVLSIAKAGTATDRFELFIDQVITAIAASEDHMLPNKSLERSRHA